MAPVAAWFVTVCKFEWNVMEDERRYRAGSASLPLVDSSECSKGLNYYLSKIEMMTAKSLEEKSPTHWLVFAMFVRRN